MQPLTAAPLIGAVDFVTFFKIATNDRLPYPYQRKLAETPEFPEVLAVPTGLGKTLAVTIAWLWRRHYHPDRDVRINTPRRLAFCLPMRVLVSQTATVLEECCERLRTAGYEAPSVSILMGGEVAKEWQEHPEKEAILIGTQDQLLSRALNRGYAMSRYAWPVHFAWLNNDCLWVIDETQLMGAGLETSAQLAGLRRKLETTGPSATLWMSATMALADLHTADHQLHQARPRKLDDDDLAEPEVAKRLNARKTLVCCEVRLTKANAKDGKYAKELAAAILQAHQPGTLTLVVVNRVARAQQIFRAVQAQAKGGPTLALIHSRMRGHDRQAYEAILQAPEGDRIVIATQAIEAGVDVSARTLFTELAPWSSLVQRFGRCNRHGEATGQVFWIDIESEKDVAVPYEEAQLVFGREQLPNLPEVGPQALTHLDAKEPPREPHGFRKRDLLDLFDTTPDLLGNDLDVSRYIRDSDDSDVQIYWRDLSDAKPLPEEPGPQREELCSVRISDIRTFLKKKPHVWRWSVVDELWLAVNEPRDVIPGHTLLLDVSAGGYDVQLGWTGDPAHHPTAVPSKEEPEEGNGGIRDAYLGGKWVALTAHTDDVANAMVAIESFMVPSFGDSIPWESLRKAARFHDLGKGHVAFQTMLGRPDHDPEGKTLWAKSDGTHRGAPYADAQNNKRTGYRHELASALAFLQLHGEDVDANLVAYVIASHHGKVRTSIRAAPNEEVPRGIDFAARGVWHGDVLPAADLGNDVQTPNITLSLQPMAMGEGSWLERVLALREAHGPFRLAYLESLFRVADWRGSSQGA